MRHNERFTVSLLAVKHCCSSMLAPQLKAHRHLSQAAVGAVLLICNWKMRNPFKLLVIVLWLHMFDSSLYVPFSWAVQMSPLVQQEVFSTDFVSCIEVNKLQVFYFKAPPVPSVYETLTFFVCSHFCLLFYFVIELKLFTKLHFCFWLFFFGFLRCLLRLLNLYPIITGF